mmetsp:Transcript_10318/g.19793  ORF Transcript_10318/g.19793 Transcript_10318/m.19793 type:complete len:336 (-) Transcript_10318:314-1321(-)|eukprot:CAMPEP_0170198668 /NCGR_PEP_ID=MMETSP0040_2-20121228/68907_1 /TAXON_ID=641309 /ORGANISM="Lotharella oceanica, Strain CCMP622" /LENGTH=335 /DNA_ID=CAMNT_0010448695 /DNA_START=971 /DNA_END=1978 /DNA_ORIENTATION=+
MMMNNHLYPSSGFMPLAPLLCDADNSNPFLNSTNEQVTNNNNNNVLTKGFNPPSGDSCLDEKALSCKSGSSSDTEVLPKKVKTESGATASTIAVNKQEMLKLIEEQNLQKQRLLRKAEQARLSRKRKKMRMQELEKESDFLRQEVKRLKSALSAKESKIAAMASATTVPVVADSEHKEMFEQLQLIVDSGKTEQVPMHVENMLRSFKSGMPDAEKYLETIATRVSPSLPVRFLQWILTKHDSFYEDKSGLWHSLFSEETGLSSEQLEEVKKLRETCTDTPFNKNALIEQLTKHLKEQQTHQSQMLQKLSGILKPDQLAKFLLWVRKHGEVCIKIR